MVRLACNRSLLAASIVVSATLAALASCNAAFGVDELCFDCTQPSSGGSTSSSSSTSSGGNEAGGGSGGSGAGAGGCTEGDVRPCYDGPEGTVDVGACHAGQQGCSSDGQWGPCLEQVLPEPETCGDEDDRDCNGYDCGETVWAFAFGDGADQEPWRLGRGPGPSLVVAGTYQGTLDLGGGALPSSGLRAGFVGAVSLDGDYVASWSTLGASDLQIEGLAMRSSGDVVVGGDFQSTVTFGGDQLSSSGGIDGFVAQLDFDGNAIWATRFGGNAQDNVQDVALFGSGDVLVAGYLGDAAGDFMGTTLPNLGGYDVVLARLAALSGGVEWAYSYGSTNAQYPYGAQSRPTGDVVVVGRFQNQLDFGSGAMLSGGSYDVFVTAIEESGQPAWSRSFGAAGEQEPLDVAVSHDSRVAVVGRTDGTFPVGSTVLANAGGLDAFVAVLDPSGEPLWARSFGGSGDDFATGAAFDADGSLWLVGRFEQSIDLGGGPLTGPAGEAHAFVAKLGADGTHLHSRAILTTGMGNPPFNYWSDWRQLLVDEDGFAYLTGYFDGTIDLGNETLACAGGSDGFIAKLAP